MSVPKLALAAQQRALIAILKDRPDPSGTEASGGGPDPYLELVRRSRGLAMLRTITAWWRRFDLQRYAPLTTGALAHTGRLEEELTRLASDAHTPSAVDALGIYFVDRLVTDDDPLVAAVASTERALIMIARGSPSIHKVAWDRDPAAVLNALMEGRAPDKAAAGRFRVVVSADLPDLIKVEDAS